MHTRNRAKEIALGDAVIESIREFHVWCRNDPVLSNEGRLQADKIVGSATFSVHSVTDGSIHVDYIRRRQDWSERT
jgi:hypothetical protein